MPRKPRFIIPGLPQHVIIRGVNRDPIFYQDIDYRYYLMRLREAMEKHGCFLHSYALMTNHVHLLLTPADTLSLGKTVQVLGRYYVQYFNESYGRTGTLWEGRYKSALVDTERYLLICYRYIELNPVRAGMVTHPADYPWSSYRHNAIGQSNLILTPHDKYNQLGATDKERKDNYQALFEAHLSELELDEIRHAANREWVLGSDHFKARVARQLERRTTPLSRGGDHRSSKFKGLSEINRH